MQRTSYLARDGFTLLETVVATGILVTALAGIAQLLALSIRSTRDAGSQSAALYAAQGKLEELRSLTFTYDPLGAPVTDPGLGPSGGLTLAEDTAGFVDYLDAGGTAVDLTHEDHGVSWSRRWRITSLDPFSPEALVLEVCVFRWPAGRMTPRAAAACLATVRGRQP